MRKTQEAHKDAHSIHIHILKCSELLQPGSQAASEAAKPSPFCRECHSRTQPLCPLDAYRSVQTLAKCQLVPLSSDDPSLPVHLRENSVLLCFLLEVFCDCLWTSLPLSPISPS